MPRSRAPLLFAGVVLVGVALAAPLPGAWALSGSSGSAGHSGSSSSSGSTSGAMSGAMPGALALTNTWAWPVEPPHRVLAAYRGPQTPYSAGHRGIDLVAAAGDPVLAVHDGVVAFAGMVVDRPVLTLSHDDDLLSSVEPVLALVSPGDRVVTGQTIGIVFVGGHCAGCLHLGVRSGGRYVSPLVFLGGAERAVLWSLPR
ncbi:MAG: M23 family metallopeptidase [Cryobacterium sp.]